MKPVHLLFALGGAFAVSACAPRSVDVSFYYDWTRCEESSTETLVTTQAVITSQKFWSAHVGPKLGRRIPVEVQEQVRSSIQIRFGKGTRGTLREVRLRLAHAPEQELRETAEAIVAGLDAYVRLLSSPRGAPVAERS